MTFEGKKKIHTHYFTLAKVFVCVKNLMAVEGYISFLFFFFVL